MSLASSITAFKGRVDTRITQKVLLKSIKKADVADSFDELADLLIQTSNTLVPDGVLSGLGLSNILQQLTVAPGSWVIQGQTFTLSNSRTFTLQPKDTSLSRFDLVYADDTGSIGVITGTLSDNPVLPSLPANSIEVGFVSVTPTAYVPNQVLLTGLVNLTTNQLAIGGRKGFVLPVIVPAAQNNGEAVNLGQLNGFGYLTSINSSMINTALGYSPANDSNVVHKTGTESIFGDKTFTGNTILTGASATTTISTTSLNVISNSQFHNSLSVQDGGFTVSFNAVGLVNAFYVNQDDGSGSNLGIISENATQFTTTPIGIYGYINNASGRTLSRISLNYFARTNGNASQVILGDGTYAAYGGGGGGTGTVTSLTDNTANGVAVTWINRSSTPVPTIALGAITPTSVNGISAATMAFMDATSSIQTQFNNTLTKPLTGLSISGGAVIATDGTLTAIGKLQNQINGIAGGLVYKGVWDANANSPTITSGVGTTGWFYKVGTAGTTTIDGVTPWNVNDLILFDGTSWDKIDGISAEVTSFNSRTGAITLTSLDVTNAIGFTTIENSTNKATSFTTLNNTLYPTTQAVSTYVAGQGFLTSNQSISLSGDVSGSGTTTITTTIGASKVTNTMLAGSIAASKLVGTDITTVGTISTGTWAGTTISAIHGGTGQGSYATGDMLTALNSTTLTKINIGSAGQVWTVQTGTGLPGWSNATGGFSNPMTTTGDIIYSNSGSTATRLGIGTANQVLTVSNSTGLPVWANASVYFSGEFTGDGLTSLTPLYLLSPTSQTVNYTASQGDYVICDTATTGSFTVLLPTSTIPDKALVAVKMVSQSGTRTVTINAAGSDVFNKSGGPTSLTLSLLNQGVLLQYKLSAGIWYVVSDSLSLSTLDARYVINPMTSVGDLIVGGTSGAATRLGIGSTGQYLRTTSGTAAWTTITITDLPVFYPDSTYFSGDGTDNSTNKFTVVAAGFRALFTSSNGIVYSGGNFSNSTTQSITTLSNLTTNGVVTTSGGTGALGVTSTTGTGNVVFSTSPTLVTPALGTPSAAILTNATGLPLTAGVTGILPVANGGTGTSTPGLVAGTNVTITGTWPNQTINSSGGGSYTFSTGLTNTSGTITVNTSQNISTLSNLTSNGLIKTSGGTGALSIATSGTDYVIPSVTTLSSLTTVAGGTFGTNAFNSTAYLPLTAGSGTPLSGGLVITMASPNLYFSNTASSSKLWQLVVTGNDFAIRENGSSSSLYLVAGGFVGVNYSTDPTSGNKFAVNGNTYLNGSLTVTGLTTAGLVTTTSGGVISSVATVPSANLGSGTANSTTFLRGDGTWATPSGSGFTNPMTTAGDIIYGGVAGAGTRQGIGSTGQYLRVTSAVPTWTTIPIGDLPSFFPDPTYFSGTGVDNSTNIFTVVASGFRALLSAGTGLTYTSGSFSVNTSQSISTLSNLTSNGIVTTSGGTGALSITATNGSGNVVLTTTPTLVTPVLGAATATSINKVTITSPTTSATLTLITGSSLITAGAFALTLTSTAATNATFPTGTGTLGYIGGTTPVTGAWTFKNAAGIGLLGTTSGTISLLGQASAGTYNFNFPITAGTAGQILTSQGGGSTAMTWTNINQTITNTSGTDAAYTISLASGDNVILPAITAARTVTFPTIVDGKIFYIFNNNSSANTWSINATPNVKSPSLSTQSTITNQTYTAFIGSSAQSAWIRLF